MKLILSALLMTAAGARAQEIPAPVLAPAPVVVVTLPERRHMLSLGLGLIGPVSKVDFRSIGGGSADNGDIGVQLGGQYFYFLTQRLAAGLGAEYIDRSGTLSTRLYPAADASVSGDSWVVLALLRYALRERGSVRPFVLVGAGGGWNKTTIDVRPSVWPDTATHETRRLIDDSAWVPAGTARLGVDVDVDPFKPGIITLEAGWTGLASARYAATPRGQARGLGSASGPLNIIAFSARYGWRF